MSYAPDQIAMCRPAAWLVDNMLKGTMPGEIPVEQPTTLALRINRKVADALGLMFPDGLLSVIERILCRLLMLWTARPPAREAIDVGAVEAPTIRRS
jgi:ABC-type uncharacterized transport system substrate-binding protein